MSTEHLAELVPCSTERVHRLTELSLLDADGSGCFASADVHIVRLMAAFEDAGISLEDVSRGVASGEFSFSLGRFLPEPVEATATYEGVAAQLGPAPTS